MGLNYGIQQTSNPENIVFLLDAANEKSYSSNNTHSLGRMDAVGQEVFTSSGTHSWTCPDNVNSVSVVCVGGGGAGGSKGSHQSNGTPGQGGYGGGLGYKNNISVTPGQTYTVVVGGGGQANSWSSDDDGGSGGDSYFISSTVVKGGGGPGGRSGSNSSVTSNQTAASYVGDGGGDGGLGGSVTTTNGANNIMYNSSGGGGGAGGYSGSGGNGGAGNGALGGNPGLSGSGGGGGGGSSAVGSGANNRTVGSGGGGGVGLLGEGTSGGATPTPSFSSGSGSYGGHGGSGGSDADDAPPDSNEWAYTSGTEGALYGGGGGGWTNGGMAPKNGAGGAVRIMWGPNRAYPSTSTTDQTASGGSGPDTIWADVSKGRGQALLLPNASFVSNGTASYFQTSNTSNVGICSVTNSSLLNPSYFTISVWVKFDALTYTQHNQNENILVSKKSSFNTGSYALTIIGNNDRDLIGFYTYHGGSPNFYTVEYPFEIDTWYNITGTYSSSAKVLYVNGSPVNSASGGAATLYDNSDLYIGERTYNAISNVSIYDKAFTAAEVQQNFNAHRGRFGI